MNALARVIVAREALEDGDVYLAETILRELEDDLAAEERRWVDVNDGPLVPDMSVFEDAGRGS